MTDKELFMQWIEKENAPLLQEAQEGSQFHKDILVYMLMGWQASAKREGFVLVPKEPTEEMLRLGMIESYKYSGGVEETYKAMLSAVEVQND